MKDGMKTLVKGMAGLLMAVSASYSYSFIYNNVSLDSVKAGVPFALKGADGRFAEKNFVYDGNTKNIYTRTQKSQQWKMTPVGGGYFNIRSLSRPNGCIYDSSGTSSAKFDRSCNRNYSRAEWRIQPYGGSDFYGYKYRIINKKGRCLEVDTSRKKLLAVTCDGGFEQQFYFVY